MPSFRRGPTPTLAATASVDLYATQAISAVTATATEPLPTGTPNPTATKTPTSTATLLPPTNTPSATPTNTPSPTATATLVPPTVTATSPPLPTAPPATEAPPTDPPPPPPPASNPILDLNLVPTQPQGFLDKFRVVSFYGTPLGSGLGILGDQIRSQTLRILRTSYVPDYQAHSDRLVLPGYHIISTVANLYPPDYRHHLDLGIIEEWVATTKETGVVVFLDIQPGRANIMDEFNRIRYLLYEPHVHLAIDPEFAMNEEQVVGINIGQLYAAQINEIQVNMNGIGYEIGLNKVLILHQFKDSMLPDKALIEPYPFVEMVIDGDGFGPSGPKIRNYLQYAGEPGFEYGGFKLFPTDGDSPLMTPTEVMGGALYPQPSIIIYQ